MRLPALLLATASLLSSPPPARAECAHCNEKRDAATAPGAAAPRFTRSTHAYPLPDVELTDQDGRRVRLAALLTDGSPVALNFVFTTCTTICPVMSNTFAALRTRLGPDGARLRMVSISIDPERDTPEVLRAYAARFGAPADWRFLTGDPGAVQKVLAAFEALTPAKSNHRPLTFLRGATGDWVRIDGLAGAADLAREVEALRPARSGA